MSFLDDFQAALHFGPEARSLERRRAMLTLDELFEEARVAKSLSSGSFDIVLQGYRLWHLFEEKFREFRPSGIKPAVAKDALFFASAAIVIRSETPPALITDQALRVIGSVFGQHLVGLCNAFLRRVSTNRSDLVKEATDRPQVLFPEWLVRRWEPNPRRETQHSRTEATVSPFDQFSRRVFSQSGGGIWGYGPDLALARRTLSDWKKEAVFQAIDPGSYRVCEWIADTIGDRPCESLLDCAAAPGGKGIWLHKKLKERSPRLQTTFVEAKFPRLEHLKENLSRWSLTDECKTFLFDWEGAAPFQSNFSVILADLPCTGSGTLFTRPDLLLNRWDERIASLQETQKQIITGLMKHANEASSTFVVICSVDPQEIEWVSRCVGTDPVFSSWSKDIDAEGLHGWHIRGVIT